MEGGRKGTAVDRAEYGDNVKVHAGLGEARWTGRSYHLGRNKEMFDAELYALYRASKILEERGEESQNCIIWTNSAAALNRTASDEMGPGQRFALALMEVHSRLANR